MYNLKDHKFVHNIQYPTGKKKQLTFARTEGKITKILTKLFIAETLIKHYKKLDAHHYVFLYV